MSDRQFDIKRDNELINANSHFWCSGCITARPLAEKSLDERYCLQCCKTLMAEAALDNKRKAWMPRGAVLSTGKGVKEVVTSKDPVEMCYPCPVTNSNKGVESDLNDRIAVLDGAGLKARDISAALAKEGVFISYRTVYRRLQGLFT